MKPLNLNINVWYNLISDNLMITASLDTDQLLLNSPILLFPYILIIVVVVVVVVVVSSSKTYVYTV
jgi:hypothetical protein